MFPAAQQSDSVQHTILLILSVGTLCVLAIGFFISLRFRLNLHTHSVLREETNKMRLAGHPVPDRITPEARETVETLAGLPYENLWGNNNIGFLNRHRPPAPPLRPVQLPTRRCRIL